MKILLKIVFFSLISFTTFAQVKFPKGAFLVENQLHSDVKKVKSIIFVLHGAFDTYPIKSSIEDYLKDVFKKSEVKVAFVYWDQSLNQLTNPDVLLSDYNVACLLSFTYIKKLNDYFDYRRQFYSKWQIVCEKGTTAESLGNATIDMYSGYLVDSENKKASKLIYKLFTE